MDDRFVMTEPCPSCKDGYIFYKPHGEWYPCHDCGGSGELCYCIECERPIPEGEEFCHDCFGKCVGCDEVVPRSELDEEGYCNECNAFNNNQN